MRKITQNSVNAFLNEQPFSASNMTVLNEDDTTKLFLHSNCIAFKRNGLVSISNAGWPTTTTKERLNGILDILGKPYRVYQSDFVWYWKNDMPFEDNCFHEL